MLKHKTIFVSCILLIWYFNVINAEKFELRQLNVLFRHGDRTPETFPKRFPNDPHMNDTFYPMGPGSLTNIGKRRMYRLGEFLRNRYTDFLGNVYEERRLYGLSSHLSRTKMSLQLLMAALYPPEISSLNKWHEKLNWQPTPANYHEFRKDRYFNRDKCELYIEEMDRVYKLPEVQEKLKEHESFIKNLTLTVGKKSLLTIDDMLILHNNLDIEKRMNLTMEPWMIETLENGKLKKMRMLYYELTSYNDLLKRLHTGFLFREISENMFKASNKTSDYDKKLFLYSGHDKNIIGLLQSLNVYDSHFPEYSSALIFELLSLNEKYYVKVLYYLGIPETMKTLTIPGCAALCPLDQFIELTQSARTLDEELDCKINQGSYFENEEI